MIDKFAIIGGEVSSEFIDLNRASQSMALVSLGFRSSLPSLVPSYGELRNRDTSLRLRQDLPKDR